MAAGRVQELEALRSLFKEFFADLAICPVKAEKWGGHFRLAYLIDLSYEIVIGDAEVQGKMQLCERFSDKYPKGNI